MSPLSAGARARTPAGNPRETGVACPDDPQAVSAKPSTPSVGRSQKAGTRQGPRRPAARPLARSHSALPLCAPGAGRGEVPSGRRGRWAVFPGCVCLPVPRLRAQLPRVPEGCACPRRRRTRLPGTRPHQTAEVRDTCATACRSQASSQRPTAAGPGSPRGWRRASPFTTASLPRGLVPCVGGCVWAALLPGGSEDTGHSSLQRGVRWNGPLFPSAETPAVVNGRRRGLRVGVGGPAGPPPAVTRRGVDTQPRSRRGTCL